MSCDFDWDLISQAAIAAILVFLAVLVIARVKEDWERAALAKKLESDNLSWDEKDI